MPPYLQNQEQLPEGNHANEDFVHQQWRTSESDIYGSSDISFVADPYPQSNTTSEKLDTVMRVLYGQGSYSPKGNTQDNVQGGTVFFSRPFGNQSYAQAMVRYDMAVDPNFDWMLGGKWPGIYGGIPSRGCSGGHQANGDTCFSVRLMWRENGLGEVYMYVPTSETLCKQTEEVICNKQYGISVSRGRITYPRGKWTKFEIFTKVNDPPSESNGVLQVWQDDQIVVELTNLRYRTNNAFAISSLMFSTFFGGSSTQYATPHDTFAYFKNIQFSVADPVQLSPSTSSMASPSLLDNLPIFSFFRFMFSSFHDMTILFWNKMYTSLIGQ
ncbi:uncharacterized protein BX664DRAFT_257187 [Halteromyces radiatus]|uniref:uncharacterized protein n=1 Tax=Halteromyces radiatus TaxID=101107 RepID=UPI00221F9DEF|nr:uncharacterized protein BX664DRAFT_257187 [Halteromyces radiatus]KAI8096851.1 hypothetical protein BX664DRAFT_257187 [Halteromyces radiatus]